MIRHYLAACAVGLTLATPGFADYKLHILHINDLHSRIEPISKYDGTCGAQADAEGKCFGGVARLYKKIIELRDELQAKGENVIVLDAGDQFQGSLFYTTYKGAKAAEFMRGVGFDAMAVGNHEFDDGPQALANFIKAVDFPLVSGNLKIADGNVLEGKITDSLTLSVGGERIGIVSALATDTSETSSPGADIEFVDEVEALQADVDALSEAGVNKIIALTHVGLPKDKDIAANVKNLDAVVGGHSHTLLSNNNDRAAGPYPVMVGSVPVVQAYAYSKYLGHLTLSFDNAGSVTSATGEAILIDSAVAPDAAMAAKVAEMAARFEEMKARVVGKTNSAINGERGDCRTRECAMGNLVADAMLDRVKDQGVTIAIQNGGGLRASIDAGDITMGEILTVLPFQNTLATFAIKGEHLISALENGVSQIEEVKGRFPQVAGLKFSFDASKPANGGRVTSVEVMEGGAWVAIDPGKTYLVATNNYVRGGGDGYKMFRDRAENAYDFGPGLEVVVADYIGKMGDALSINLEGRITSASQ